MQDFPHCLVHGVIGDFAAHGTARHNDGKRDNIGFILRPLLLAHSKPSSSCMLPWPFLRVYAERGKEGPSTGVFSYKGTDPVGSGSTPITPFNPNFVP